MVSEAGVQAPTDDRAAVAVRQEFVALFLSQNRRAQAGLLAAAVLIALLVADHAAPAGWAWAWLVVVAGVALARMRWTDRFVRAAGDSGAVRRIAAVLALNGMLLAMPLLAFGRLAETERAAYSIILLASATASIATTAGYRLVFMAYAAPMLLALALAWSGVGAQGDAVIAGVGLGGLILLFLAFLAGVARQAWRVFDGSCRIRWAEQARNTELRQALDDADQANRVKTQFLAAASHDLRQPIHSINVLVAALSQRPLDDRSAQIVRLLDTVNRTLQSQLDGLLDISRLDAGAVAPRWESCRLDQLAAGLHATLAPVAAQRGLACRLDGQGEPVVRTDSALLLRVVGNLCDNALKFTPAGGELTLGWAVDGDRATLWVADTGVGIPTQEQVHVFREFYQVGNAERDRTRGLGLGLSIVRRLCALLEIDLQLDSELGRGTVVRLSLPMANATTPPPAPDPPEPGALPSDLVVLVVDDEVQVRDSMRLLLTEWGCRVLLADGVGEAAACAAAQPRLDAALSDLRLRGSESGVEALQAVRQRHPAARLALLTGDTDPARLACARASGFVLLHKPAAVRDLRRVLCPADIGTAGEVR